MAWIQTYFRKRDERRNEMCKVISEFSMFKSTQIMQVQPNIIYDKSLQRNIKNNKKTKYFKIYKNKITIHLKI